MTDYERLKRNSHVVIARCAYSDCLVEDHLIRASIDMVRFWDVNRPVHVECFRAAIIDRQSDHKGEA